MKKFLLFLTCIVGFFSFSKAEVYDFAFEKNNRPAATDGKTSWSQTFNDVSWSIEGDPISTSTQKTSQGASGTLYWWQFGTSAAPFKKITFTTDFFQGTDIQEIELGFVAAGQNSNYEVYTYLDNNTPIQLNGGSWSQNNVTTFKTDTSLGTVNKSLTFYLQNTKTTTSNNGAVGLNSIKITYTKKAGNKATVTLSFPKDNYTADLSTGFSAPALIVDPTIATAAVKYVSSETNVATVDATTGEVSLMGVGSTLITASILNNAAYYDVSASYTLTVIKSSQGGESEEDLKTVISHESSFNSKSSAYDLKTFTDDFGFTYKGVMSFDNGIQFNTNNKNGGAGSALVVTGFNEDYIIDYIEIDIASVTSNSGFNIYSLSNYFPDPVVGTAYVTPTGATQIVKNLEDSKKFDIQDVAFAILPGGSGLNKINSLTVHYKKLPKGDPNLPQVGSTFKKVLNSDEITEGYYIISRINGVGDEYNNSAMCVTPSENNITATSHILAQNIVTGPDTSDVNVLSTTDSDVLIVYIENKEEQWGIKTANYGDGYTTSQGYLAADGSNLIISKDFVPATVRINATSKNGEIFLGEKKITISSNESYFSCNDNGKVVQLYRYTTAQNYIPDYKDLTLRVGDEYSIELKGEHPEISYRVNGNTNIISIEEGSNIIKAQRAGENIAIVRASWNEEPEKWFAGSARFSVTVLPPLQDGQLSFRHEKVVGKFGVGVVSQAAYYLGDRKNITYTSSNPEVAEVDSETGMIRTSDIHSVGSTIITASVPETDLYKADTKTYEITIESPENSPLTSSDVTFDFNSDYGMYHFDSTSSAGDAPYENNRPDNQNPITEISEKDIKVEFGSRYRWFADGHIRLYAEDKTNKIDAATITITLPSSSESTIESIEFETPNSSVSNKQLTASNGELNGTVWNAPNGNIKTITFTAIATSRISSIKINLFTSDETTGKQVADLSFEGTVEGKERIINTFVGVSETLPSLNYNVPFDHLEFNIDEMEEGEPANPNYGIQVISSDNNGEKTLDGLNVVVYTPGVYTFRAFNNVEKYDDYYAGMAILRLNVFPRLSVVPSEKDGASLADDDRTALDELTLVQPIQNDEGVHSAEIKMPNLAELGDDLKFSTISIDQVIVKHGDEITTYKKMEDGIQGIAEGKVVDIAEMPETHSFTEDGYISYLLKYANTDDFYMESKVHVILMPQVPAKEESDEGKITLTASKNAHLQYYAFRREKGNNFEPSPMKVAPSEDSWITIDEPLEVSAPEDLEPGTQYVVKYRSVKDINEVTDNGVDVDDPVLASEFDIVTFDAEPAEVTAKITDDSTSLRMAFDPTNNEYNFEGVINFIDDSGKTYALTLGTDFKISISKVDTNDANDWVAPANESDIDSSYQSALNIPGTSLYNQYTSLFGSDDLYVDGFFIEDEMTASASEPTSSDVNGNTIYSNDINLTVPCSGKYEVTVTSIGDSYKFETVKTTFEIYPNLYAIFGTDPGFNIYGYTFDRDYVTSGTPPVIYLPEEVISHIKDSEGESLEAVGSFIPGTYFPSSFEQTGNNAATGKVESPAGTYAPNAVNYTALVNLSGFEDASTPSVDITMTITKNGATEPYTFTVTRTTGDNFNQSTGVDSISGEDGEAEYFTLQGLKVQNPDKGIYIKVQNGKAVKVLL